jgi:hypothetical protein
VPLAILMAAAVVLVVGLDTAGAELFDQTAVVQRRTTQRPAG